MSYGIHLIASATAGVSKLFNIDRNFSSPIGTIGLLLSEFLFCGE